MCQTLLYNLKDFWAVCKNKRTFVKRNISKAENRGSANKNREKPRKVNTHTYLGEDTVHVGQAALVVMGKAIFGGGGGRVRVRAVESGAGSTVLGRGRTRGKVIWSVLSERRSALGARLNATERLVHYHHYGRTSTFGRLARQRRVERRMADRHRREWITFWRKGYFKSYFNLLQKFILKKKQSILWESCI